MSLAVFRVRSFRFQLPADLFTSWAFEMETIILGWYVLVHTGSVLLLTAFASLQFLGTLAAPMFGVLGDRLGARLMLCAMRAIYAALALVMMILAFTGWLSPAWVFAVAAVAGIVRPNDLVMRNSLVGETIPPSHLMGALGMSRAIMDSARVAGALAGAGLSSMLGLGPTYVCVTSFYAASLALTFGVSRRRPVLDPTLSPSPPWGEGRVRGEKVRGQEVRGVVRAPAARLSKSRWRDLREGLLHILATPALLAAMWLAFLINLTAYPVSSGLLPYVARQVFHVDATGLGWLVASFSFGGLLASVTMVVTGGPRRAERSTLVYTAIWYALLLGFAHAGGLGAGLLLLFAAGFVQNVAMISMSATLLAFAHERFRSRVMGMRQLAVYGMTLGLMGSGALIERIGYSLTISLCAVIGLIFTLLIGMKWRASMWEPGATTGAPATAER